MMYGSHVMAAAVSGIKQPIPSTWMMKNLPSRCSDQDIQARLEELGFKDSYNFFYLPMRKAQNYGYAFINFDNQSACFKFQALAQRGLLQVRNKIVNVAPAEIQGLQNLQQHFKNSKVLKSGRANLFYGSVSDRHSPAGVKPAGAAVAPTVPIKVLPDDFLPYRVAKPAMEEEVLSCLTLEDLPLYISVR
eukprot:TRINITY_DN11741_c0_g1_i1.p1 TRINITY_DN11741_c0_g1~~TRINITY_DN11741_c0_g1_i1.p1  ORF type:complete len:190 (-),score=44.93 TRINITY_DN11741_c0_g1_i1:577-1146(-)